MEPRKLVAAGVVLVPEGRQVFPGLTVAQNLRLGAWPHKRDRSGSAAVVDRAVEYFPRLKERWSQLAGTLSGGEQQMLALARGLMARPKLMLIDRLPRFGALGAGRGQLQFAPRSFVVQVQLQSRPPRQVVGRVHRLGQLLGSKRGAPPAQQAASNH